MTGGNGPRPVRLAALGRAVARLHAPGPCLLVTDRTVGALHGAAAAASLLAAGFRVRVHAVPPGERSKTWARAGRILADLAALGAGRDACVVALGGGVVTDLAGFAASVWARGIPWVAVPTTVLGLADAAVGGKTGVDLPEGKNLAGTFHGPLLVAADPSLLATLPLRQRRNGLAEIAKMEILRGFRRGVRRMAALEGIERDAAALGAAALRAGAAKAALVARDPRETRGRRILLNLGHTVGHALEAASGYSDRLLHGEAVAVGMVAAARVAAARGLLAPGEPGDLAAALGRLGLPTDPPAGIRRRAILGRLGLDKKRRGGRIRMVLPRSRGTAVVATVAAREIAAALEAGPA